MESDIIREYDRILNYCKQNDVPKYLLQQSVDWQQGLWKEYQSLLETTGQTLDGKVVVDFGCKYGHLLPLLIMMGARSAIGIDVEDVYIDAGRAVFEKLYSNVKFLKSDLGYIPLQPETVDFVLANEVISHINPNYLDTFYAEVTRILKQNGVILISDGNNSGNERCCGKLISLYDAWENGPDGTKTDRDTVAECYLNSRKKIVRARYPDLDAASVDYLAQNTSGLFGDFLMRATDNYVKTGELIRRPYRHGVCPTYPGPSGVVIERSFHPLQVKMSLATYGLECEHIVPKPTFNRTGLIGRLKDIYVFARYHVKNITKPGWLMTEYEGFKIMGVKK